MNAPPRTGAARFSDNPDAKGRYGSFGGRYVPETLVPALDRIMTAVATGEISTDQGAKLAGIIETKRKAIETVEFDRRLSELETKKGGSQ